ncbi:endolytic transglycosylase MltG [Curvibacter sp. CHRR-16]|uniref:endolytic transglycosylase MltG n=1 Tax=Curvibacter sp. CHRR-16 TaxID=2835872 RepID=UPI001BDB145B|nr:endolytic transglycosylase MltG [Curvibacter sp. CHRR-16]
MRVWLTGLLLAVLAFVGAAAWWLGSPMPQAQAVVDLSIEAGSTPKEVAQLVRQSGIDVEPVLLYSWFRISGKARAIRAGSYEISAGTTPYELLQKLVQGDEALRSVTLVEGWNFRQVRQALAKAQALKPDTQAMADADIMQALQRPGVAAEGRFFPDTYTYAKGSSDLAVLKRAMLAMDKQLERAWSARNKDIPLQNPEQALILASIVEKETGKASDRAMISAVFNNRLAIGMRLQTDPTVIYGLGERFDGNLRKADLQQDTPYNTYTRDGLPPTPIAMPGKGALWAAVQPAGSRVLYFVARGDGSSQFSTNLPDHNRAVNQYQRSKLAGSDAP